MIPFFGYSTMDHAMNPGEVVTAKANCRLLSSIPISGSGNTFLFLDLHEPSLVHYFEGNATAIDLSATSLLSDSILTLTSNTFVLASADLGMPRQVLSIAKKLNVDVALVSKARTFDQTKAIACIGDIKGKNVVIYDDMVRTGGSLINAAEVYKKEGAEHIYALISHFACVSEEAFRELADSPIETIITTNTHPTSQKAFVQTSSFVKVLDASSIFSNAITQFLSGIIQSKPEIEQRAYSEHSDALVN